MPINNFRLPPRYQPNIHYRDADISPPRLVFAYAFADRTEKVFAAAFAGSFLRRPWFSTQKYQPPASTRLRQPCTVVFSPRQSRQVTRTRLAGFLFWLDFTTPGWSRWLRS